MKAKNRHSTVQNCFCNNLFKNRSLDGYGGFASPLMLYEQIFGSNIAFTTPKSPLPALRFPPIFFASRSSCFLDSFCPLLRIVFRLDNVLRARSDGFKNVLLQCFLKVNLFLNRGNHSICALPLPFGISVISACSFNYPI